MKFFKFKNLCIEIDFSGFIVGILQLIFVTTIITLVVKTINLIF